MRLLPAGRTAVLVELDDAAQRRRLHRALSDHPAAGTVDLVPAQTTVLVQVESADLLPGAVTHVRDLLAGGLNAVEEGLRDPVPVPVRYDGLDLSDVADVLDMTTDELVKRHSSQLWTVEFAGFMPGFGYMTGADWPFRIPRRSSPRTRIPPGSVALADGFTGAYPQASPGGWQIIGTTKATLWDEKAVPPALLSPGAVVEFQVVTS
ncbi:allophanate hydrolase subunit 1 [Cutibacterium sp.]|uniref:5-oxoprolinase subunit B family protein n=1 Tax=Cutibacterium sp. TaxID=1912221 RepID=UPI0026DB94F9|nr:allophanate hydrolase subunit 1 [Cutibacterium sp.]MDO4412777.1 allophanate hydrolase subunit 1 [Cutibacterium sp.]